MSTEFLRNRKVVFAMVGTLVLAGAAWGVVSLTRGTKSTLPKDLVRKLKAESSDSGKVMQIVHEARDRQDLTEEQRHELFENVHNVMEAQMEKRLDEYFAANESQRTAILDRQIDEMQARMKEWQQRRAQRDRENPDRAATGERRGGGPRSAGVGGGGGSGAAPSAAGPGPGGAGPRGGDRRGPPTQHQRMVRSQSRNPDRTARRMAYFTALQKRAQQRGIQMPMWGGPRGGR